MKILSILMFCFCSTCLFAQNCFFLQPEMAGGAGNAHWTSAWPSPANNGIFQHNVFSYQGILNVGYKNKKWEFITGLGYFRTGYAGSWSGGMAYQLFNGSGLVGANNNEYPSPGTATVYNPHIVLPVKVGYQLFHLSKKLTFTPYLGAEFAYNMPRKFIGYGQESTQNFNSNCYQYGVFGLAQLNLEYKTGNRIDITGGASYHYDFSPLIHGQQEYDYAMLVNLGMRYNFKHRRAANLK